MKERIKPILITGSHRSGSTWVGKILAAAPKTAYVHEPFNIGIRMGTASAGFKYPFQYITDQNGELYQSNLKRTITLKYPLITNFLNLGTPKDVLRIATRQTRFLWHRIKNDTAIVKDPIALFSSEWLSSTFDMSVLVMIRHPAAFCSSLKLKNWEFDFSNFLNQPLLMQAYLGPFEDQIREYAVQKQNIIRQGILLWNCIYQTVRIFQQKHPDWLFMRHEDLSMDPVNQFRFIYEKLGLIFTNKSERLILESSGAHNPSEQQKRDEFRRDSKKNIYNWKTRLTLEEIELIKEQTYSVSQHFYTGNEW